MENIDKLDLPPDIQAEVLSTDSNYRQHKGVAVDVLAVDGKVVTVRVKQFRKLTEEVYTSKQLIEFGTAVLSHIGAGYAIFHFRPVTFKGEGVEMVDAAWVKRRMKERGITQTEIATKFGSDKYVISKLLGGKYGFTTAWKAAFWFFFNPEENNLGE